MASESDDQLSFKKKLDPCEKSGIHQFTFTDRSGDVGI